MIKKTIIIYLITVLILGKCFAEEFSGLFVYCLDVGQGDATVFTCNGYVMMIDGGDSSSSSFIYSYLRKTLGLSHIDAIIATHPHSDHVGGLAAALNACSVDVIYTPILEYNTKPNISQMDSYNSKLLHYLSTGFNQDVLDRIAELAAALTPISEIAALLDLNEDMLRLAINDKSSPVRKVYFRAKAETAHKLRKQEIELAEVGSPLAVQLTSAYLRDMQADEDL